MPAPALISWIKYLISGLPDTNEKYYSINENQILRPLGHIKRLDVYFKDREKLNYSFLRPFFCVLRIGCQFSWFYRKVKRGILYVETENHDPVWKGRNSNGGYGRGV